MNIIIAFIILLIIPIFLLMSLLGIIGIYLYYRLRHGKLNKE